MPIYFPLSSPSGRSTRHDDQIPSSVVVTDRFFCAQVKNEIVVWDRIVRRKEDAQIHIEDGKNKYAFRELSKSFK